MRRDFQCATIQLDFQLPRRFELEYMTSEARPKADKEEKPKEEKKEEKHDRPKELAEAENEVIKKTPEPQPGYARPVMIHRAIYGSFERFIG